MRRILVKTIISLCYVPLLTWFSSSQASEADLSQYKFAQAGQISKSKAAQIAQSKHGGKVLKVTKSGSVYKVKLLLDNGRVKTVNVDANGG